MPHLASEGQPIDQLVDVATQTKAQFGERLSLHVVAMGARFDTAGLNLVPSEAAPPYFNRADTATDMAPIVRSFTQPSVLACQPLEERLQPPIGPARLADDGTIGNLRLRRAGDGQTVAVVEIVARGQQAIYRVEGIAPGDYLLDGFVRYRGLDQALRAYTLIGSGALLGDTVELGIVEVPPGTLSGPTLTFDVKGGVCPLP